MKIESVRKTPRKLTSQNAPLERLLTWWRTLKVRKHVKGKRVLDFGCGADFNSLRSFGTSGSFRCGVDIRFSGEDSFLTVDGIEAFGSLNDVFDQISVGRIPPVEIIVTLACFEHLEADEQRQTLLMMHKISTSGGTIAGTVPTPSAKPVLEFLSERLGLIDPSQIRDHRIYYDKKLITQTLKGTGWKIREYRTFQFGMNSFFVLEKLPAAIVVDAGLMPLDP